ncbi:MAG: hypothetical protein SGPRY_000581, partial [Prymnesium sp.]
GVSRAVTEGARTPQQANDARARGEGARYAEVTSSRHKGNFATPSRVAKVFSDTGGCSKGFFTTARARLTKPKRRLSATRLVEGALIKPDE